MKRTLGFALLFTVAYLLVFSSPLKKEPVLKPIWVQSLAKPTKIASTSSTNTIAFRMGNVFGYVTPDGAIKYLNTAQFNVAMDDHRFINFSSVSENLVEKDTAGRITGTISSRGYPIFMGGRFFIISTDRTALSELDRQGATVWTRDFGSVVTSMDVNSSSVVIGLLNGSVSVLDKSGQAAFRYSPSGSKLSIIYGCAISANGEYIAVVSGLDPQRFILLARDTKGQYRPRRVVDLPTDMRHQVMVHFFGTPPDVYVETPGAIRYFSVGNDVSGKIAIPGAVAAMASADSVISALSRAGGGEVGTSSSVSSATRAELTVFAAPGRVLARSAFNGNRLFATSSGAAIYLGVDNRLVRIDYTLE